MMIYFVDKEVEHITFLKTPEALFTPMSQLPSSEYYLKDFTWHAALRPKSKSDL